MTESDSSEAPRGGEPMWPDAREGEEALLLRRVASGCALQDARHSWRPAQTRCHALYCAVDPLALRTASERQTLVLGTPAFEEVVRKESSP